MSITRITSDQKTWPPKGVRVMVLLKEREWDFAELKMLGGDWMFENLGWHKPRPMSNFIAWMPEPPTDLAEEQSVKGWADHRWFADEHSRKPMPIYLGNKSPDLGYIRVRVTPIQEPHSS